MVDQAGRGVSRIVGGLAAVLLAVSLVTGAPPPAAAQPPAELQQACPAPVPPTTFDDVASGGAHGAAIACLLAWGITQGVSPSQYAPQQAVSRAQMATFLSRLIGVAGQPLTVPPGARFDDVSGVHAENIEALADVGIALGTSATTFSPSQEVTRAQMATFIVRTLEHLGHALDPAPAPFDDVAAGGVHAPAIGALAQAGVVQGRTPTTYDPQAAVTRAQMASFLMRTADLLVAAGVTAPPYVDAGPDPDPDPDVTTVALAVEDCAPRLVAEGDTVDAVVREGDEVLYDLLLRNDPVGPCLGGAAGPTVEGSVRVSASSTATRIIDLAMWLEREDGGQTAVLPASAELTADPEADAPDGCPGGEPSGCAAELQDTVGNISFPEGAQPALPAGVETAVPFVFFPSLDEEDIAALTSPQSATTLAVAVTTADETSITRRAVAFDDAVALHDVDVTVTTPDGSSSTSAAATAIAPGIEVPLDGFATYRTGTTDEDVISTTFEAVAHGEPGSSATTTVTSVVTADDSVLAALVPTVWPEVVPAGVPTEVFVSVAPRSEVDGPVTYEAGALAGSFTEASGVHSAVLVIDSDTDVDVTVSASIHGVPATGSATITVAETSLPTMPAPAQADPAVHAAPEGGRVLGNRIVITTEPGVTDDDVLDIAEPVTATVVGRLSAERWQLALPTTDSYEDLAALLDSLEGTPGLVDVTPLDVGTVDAVTPNDPQVGDQDHLTQAGVDRAWAFNTGAASPVTIAVIDTGVDRDHPDLQDVLLTGRDFADPGTPPQDTNGHGTHVAGIAAAASDNGIGVAGVNWHARVLPVKAFPDGQDPEWTEDTLSASIDYAVARGARVINMSLSGPSRMELVAEALDGAWRANRVVVATAGNTGVRERRYPSGFGRTERFSTWWNPFNTRTYTTDVLSIGNIAADGRRQGAPGSGSTFGPWVDLAAPGTDVLSTDLVDMSVAPWRPAVPNTYTSKTGTSMSAPLVAGVASLIVSDDPAVTTAGVRRRLVSTGTALDDEIGPALDAFQATFNGSFEGGLDGWETSGTVRAIRRLGTVTPRHGDRMAFLSTGPGSVSTQATLQRSVQVPAGALNDDVLRLRLRYNYLSSEYPNFVGTEYNDLFTVDLVLPNGESLRVVDESVNTTAWTIVPGIDFPSGDGTVGQSGWRTATVDIPAASLQGALRFDILVMDQGDDIYDSVALIDDIAVR